MSNLTNEIFKPFKDLIFLISKITKFAFKFINNSDTFDQLIQTLPGRKHFFLKNQNFQ